MKSLVLTMASIALFCSCNSSTPKQEPSAGETGLSWALSEAWKTDTILSTCESVLYDEDRNLLYVSCINGAPAEKNGEGFISVLNPDGTIKELKWIAGLNAPKGMGLIGNLLYVADIDQLVIIDIEREEIIESLSIEGASFLNDVAIGSTGRVYFTDSDTGYIWVYNNGKLDAWITDGLLRPNGLYVEESRILLTSSGSEDLKIIDKSTGSFETVTSEIGHGDGIEFTGTDGYYIATSWDGEIFMIAPDFSRESLLKTSDQGVNSADIGFNLDKQILYVPTFFDNRVVAYKLERQAG